MLNRIIRVKYQFLLPLPCVQRNDWYQIELLLIDSVTYWPRPSCQNRKCTCVNNRCIRSRNIRIWPWTGWTECEIVTLAGRRVGVKLLYNPGDRKLRQLEIRCGRENQHPAEGTLRPPIEQLQLGRRWWNENHVPERLDPQAPGWAAQENGKETLLWP